MSRPWMALYVGDYLADTAHLRAAEHGAYLLLIMHYWRTGGLPDDDGALSRITRLSPAEWRKARPTIEAFFQPGWKHKRIEIEIAEAVKISEAGRKAGLASAEARRNAKSASAERSLDNRSDDLATKGQPSQPQSQSQPSLRSGEPAPPKRTRTKPRVPLPELWQVDQQDWDYATERGFTPDLVRQMGIGFANHHRGKGSLMADWHAAWRTWCENEIKFSSNRGIRNGSAQVRPNSSITESLRRDLAELEGPESADLALPASAVLRISDRSVR